MKHLDISACIERLVPGAKFTVIDLEIIWEDDREMPSWEELLKEYERTKHMQKRALSYPSIGDQLDSLFHNGMFPEDMANKIQAVKDAFPKENEKSPGQNVGPV